MTHPATRLTRLASQLERIAADLAEAEQAPAPPDAVEHVLQRIEADVGLLDHAMREQRHVLPRRRRRCF